MGGVFGGFGKANTVCRSHAVFGFLLHELPLLRELPPLHELPVPCRRERLALCHRHPVGYPPANVDPSCA
jgi:hypothetical protein